MNKKLELLIELDIPIKQLEDYARVYLDMTSTPIRYDIHQIFENRIDMMCKEYKGIPRKEILEGYQMYKRVVEQ